VGGVAVAVALCVRGPNGRIYLFQTDGLQVSHARNAPNYIRLTHTYSVNTYILNWLALAEDWPAPARHALVKFVNDTLTRKPLRGGAQGYPMLADSHVCGFFIASSRSCESKTMLVVCRHANRFRSAAHHLLGLVANNPSSQRVAT
jgi:hypothetical protein